MRAPFPGNAGSRVLTRNVGLLTLPCMPACVEVDLRALALIVLLLRVYIHLAQDRDQLQALMNTVM
jgi:hypothetical protein